MKPLNILLFLFFSLNAFSQNNFMKWDNFRESNLKMTTYDLDQEANAVVLGQTAHVKFRLRSGQQVMSYNYHIRIKILSKAGLDQATIELPYYNDSEIIKGIKGVTATVKNGQLIKTKLNKKDIFQEQINNSSSQRKFTMPAVEVGSIIEYKYELISEHLTLLKDLYFQREIPIRRADVTFSAPEFFRYVFLTQTPIPFDSKTRKTISYDLGANYRVYPGTLSHWVAKDMPAIIKESFITSIDSYRQRLRIQLKEVEFPGQLTRQIFSSWANTREKLMQHNNFGRRFIKNNGIKKISEQCVVINNESISEEEKIRGIYEFVQQHMEWNGGFGYMIDESFNHIFKEKSGDAGEINLMLLSLLKDAGFDAYPVLVSTRKNGKPTSIYPILKQFNYLIVEVMLDDGERLLLDAVDPTLPIGMVSYRCLNDQAWSLRGKEGTWIDISAKKTLKIIQINLELHEDGSVKGFMKSMYDGYKAVDQRKDALSSKEEDYLEERIKKNIPNIKIDSLVLKNTKEIYDIFYETIYFTIPSAAEVSGDMIYFNPLLDQGWEENPFKLKERTYPIDLGYPFHEQVIITVTPPKGYILEESPKNVKIGLLDKGGSFKFLTNTSPTGQTQIISKLQMLNSKYHPDNYQFIKQFFDMVIEKHATQLVYKKSK